MDDDDPATVPTPDESTPSGADHPFEASETDDTTRADRESPQPPAGEPDAGRGSPPARG